MKLLRFVAVLALVLVSTIGFVSPTRAAEPKNSYTVKGGDTVYGIGMSFNLSTDAMIKANPSLKTKVVRGKKIVLIYPGQELNIPVPKSVKKAPPTNNTSAPVLEKKAPIGNTSEITEQKPLASNAAPAKNLPVKKYSWQKEANFSDKPAEPVYKSRRESWQGYVGRVNYSKAHDAKDNHGHSMWYKLSVWPFGSDNPETHTSFTYGGTGFYVTSKGVANKKYVYKSNEKRAFLSGKGYFPHGDIEGGIGLSWLNSKGYWMGKRNKNQFDNSWVTAMYLSLYPRRDRGEKLFPETDISFESRKPFHTKVREGKKTDYTSFELAVTQYLYDFGNNALTITPGVKAGIGYQGSSDDSSYPLLGGVVKLSSHGKTLGNVSRIYKFQGDGQWSNGWAVSPSGIINAIKAFFTRPSTYADLHPKAHREVASTYADNYSPNNVFPSGACHEGEPCSWN